jgi:adenine-specific DNA-methyltransferase
VYGWIVRRQTLIQSNVCNGYGPTLRVMTRKKALVKNGEVVKKEIAALSPVEELEKIRKRLAELERGQTLGLVWRDIPEDVETLLRDEMPVLMHEPDLDIPGKIPSDQSHLLIEGDNLHALHVLQATHRAAVDVIYIDPPYNTGREFIYNDKLIDEENTWRHSAWLSFMGKRLTLARALMKDIGVMFVSINQIEAPRLWLLLEGIFGEQNIEVMIWHKISESGSAGQGKMKVTHRFRNDSEYVFAVYRNKESVRFNKLSKLKSYKNLYPNLDNDLRGPWISSEICKSEAKSMSTGKNFYVIKSPGGVSYARQWHVTHSEFQSLDMDNRIYWGAGKTLPRLKKFVDEPQPTTPTSLLTGYSQTDGIRDLAILIGPNAFDNPKPVELVQYLIELASKPDSLVLDFFAGSGTTLHAVAKLNAQDGGTRQCILVTNNENQISREVTHPRIKAALTGKWVDKAKHDPLPGSLSVYKTGFIKRLKSPDRMRTEIAKHTVDLIAIKEGSGTTVSRTADLTVLHGLNKTIAVVPGLDPDHVKLCASADKKVREGNHKTVYLFTWSNQGVEEEIAALWPGWDVQPLPSEMLAALRRNVPAPRLFDGDGGAQ